MGDGDIVRNHYIDLFQTEISALTSVMPMLVRVFGGTRIPSSSGKGMRVGS